MDTITIALGTASDQKIAYLREVLDELKISAELLPFSVPSDVSDQPKTSAETERGAVNRAVKAFKLAPKADIGLGIEVGYHEEKHGYEMFCWVAIIAENGYQITNQSHRFLLPKYYQEVLQQYRFMGDNLEGYPGITFRHEGHRAIDDTVRRQKSIIENAITYALVRYLAKEDY